ncbi:hypothetical protein SDJN03_01518, partial [Cucurbita argyrosperma subsp. sororia]
MNRVKTNIKSDGRVNNEERISDPKPDLNLVPDPDPDTPHYFGSLLRDSVLSIVYCCCNLGSMKLIFDLL